MQAVTFARCVQTETVHALPRVVRPQGSLVGLMQRLSLSTSPEPNPGMIAIQKIIFATTMSPIRFFLGEGLAHARSQCLNTYQARGQHPVSTIRFNAFRQVVECGDFVIGIRGREILGNWTTYLAAVNKDTGEIAWEKEIDAKKLTSLKLSEGHLVLNYSDKRALLDATTGSDASRTDIADSFVAKSGELCKVGDETMVHVGALADGHKVCFNGKAHYFVDEASGKVTEGRLLADSTIKQRMITANALYVHYHSGMLCKYTPTESRVMGTVSGVINHIDREGRIYIM